MEKKSWKPITISIPEHLLKQLASLKGDVSRSRYIQRLIEEHLNLRACIWIIQFYPYRKMLEKIDTATDTTVTEIKMSQDQLETIENIGF